MFIIRLFPRNPKILFSHFHFLLDSPVLMQKFVHVVLSQVIFSQRSLLVLHLVPRWCFIWRFPQVFTELSNKTFFFQPFEERQKWFYENLFKQNNQDGQGSYNIDEKNVIEVKRGTVLL